MNFDNNKDIGILYNKILEEIKKGIIDLYEECKMDSLESQPLDTAYKNLSNFFGRLTKVADNLEHIRLSMSKDKQIEPDTDTLRCDRLIRNVLVDGKEHPQNLTTSDFCRWRVWTLEYYNVYPCYIDEISELSLGHWEDCLIEKLNNIKSTALETLDIEYLLGEINLRKKLVINELKKEKLNNIFSEKEKETNTDLDDDDFFNNLK